MTTHAISVSGDCSLRTIADLHTVLQDGFRQGDEGVVVDMAAVDDLDVTFIQLMLSAAKTAAASARVFSVVNMAPPLAARFACAGVDATQFAARA